MDMVLDNTGICPLQAPSKVFTNYKFPLKNLHKFDTLGNGIFYTLEQSFLLSKLNLCKQLF